MRRRALLGSLAAGTVALAGCQTRASDDANTTDRTTTDPDTAEPPATDDGDDERQVGWPNQMASTVTLETQPRVLSLFPTGYRSRDGGRVDLSFSQTATADHPATVRVRLTNANDFSNVFRLDDHPPLGSDPGFDSIAGGLRSRSSYAAPDAPNRIYFAPLPDQSLPSASPDYRRASNGVWCLAAEPDGRWLPATRRLDAGESVTVEFAVVTEPNPEDYVSATRHRLQSVEDRTLTIAAWNPEKPGPRADSRFAGESFPALPGDDETGESSARWYHEAGEESAVFLRPTAERTNLPSTVTFSLVNHTTEPASGNPYYWSLYKLAGGDWHKVAPREYPLPMASVPPGGTHDYRFRLSNGEQLPCSDGTPVGHLGGGTYAVSVGMSVENRTHAAVFEIDADPVAVELPDAMDVSRDGDAVTVTSPRWDAGHGRGHVTVEPADDAEEVLVPEVAARRPVFRNTLPLFEDGVSSVHLRTSDGIARNASETPAVSFRDEAFAYSGRIESQ